MRNSQGESPVTLFEIWVTARTMPSWCWNRMQTMWNSQRNSFHTFKFDHFKTQERAREFVQNFLKKQGIEVLKANHAFYACWNCVCQVWESPCHYAFWMKLAGRRNHSERDWRKVRGQAQSPARWNCGGGWIKVLLTRVGSEHIGVLEQRCYNWWYNSLQMICDSKTWSHAALRHLIDNHYGCVAEKAVNTDPHDLVIPDDALKSFEDQFEFL